MSALGRNIFALYGANALTAIAGFLATPFYLHYLGIEAYALTGILATLQAWFALLDMGLTPALSRSVTQFSAGLRDATWLWSVFKGLERIYGLLAVAATLIVIAFAPWAADNWLNPQTLGHDEIAMGLAMMGVIISSRLWCGLYLGGVSGMQRMDWLSAFTAISAVARIAISLAVLNWISPSIVALMLTQAALGIAEVILIRRKFLSLLPEEGRTARRNPAALRDIFSYSVGLAAITVVSVLLTSLDKLILPALLPLERFSFYMLAVNATAILYRMISPVYTAVLPRLTQLAATGDEGSFTVTYHRAAQLVTVMTVPVGMLLVMFPAQSLLAWTGDPAAAVEAAGMLRVMAIATVLHGFMYVPYAAQLAHGWTKLTLYLNIVLCLFLIPGMILGVMNYGAIAAAFAWLVVNVVYMSIGQWLMTRRILRGELVRFYLHDILPVVLTVGVVAYLLHWVAPLNPSRWTALFFLACVGSTLALTGALASSLGREKLGILSRMIQRRLTL